MQLTPTTYSPRLSQLSNLLKWYSAEQTPNAISYVAYNVQHYYLKSKVISFQSEIILYFSLNVPLFTRHVCRHSKDGTARHISSTVCAHFIRDFIFIIFSFFKLSCHSMIPLWVLKNELWGTRNNRPSKQDIHLSVEVYQQIEVVWNYFMKNYSIHSAGMQGEHNLGSERGKAT